MQFNENNSDDPNMREVIQSLNDTPNDNSPNEPMSPNSRTITNIKSKVNVFIHNYATVSKLDLSQIDRYFTRQFKKRLSGSSTDDESCVPYQMGELLSAIKMMKCKGAAGLQQSTFISQVTQSFSPLRFPIRIQLIVFSCSLSTYLEGFHNNSITGNWKISWWSYIFPPHQSFLMYFHTPGINSWWFSLLHCHNQKFVQPILSQNS